MTIFAILDRATIDELSDFITEIEVIEGKSVKPVVIDRSELCRHPCHLFVDLKKKLESGDAIHVRTLSALGRTISDIISLIESLNDIGVRVVIAELDGAEFIGDSTKNLLDVLRVFSFET
ncbi:recombinase family protein [Paracoccus sp. TK19116]|uniref:Recombinase family protein n=1 Tax=Paracoccus albicereus TaxID=2922394 RepID=A0ABT1MMN8_9RHOB|nr:recombinase family protein [Paracoccus albicereus]MCQ0969553.1 recombinase family protein [Paracoccus albicereus]